MNINAFSEQGERLEIRRNGNLSSSLQGFQWIANVDDEDLGCDQGFGGQELNNGCGVFTFIQSQQSQADADVLQSFDWSNVFAVGVKNNDLLLSGYGSADDLMSADSRISNFVNSAVTLQLDFTTTAGETGNGLAKSGQLRFDF